MQEDNNLNLKEMEAGEAEAETSPNENQSDTPDVIEVAWTDSLPVMEYRNELRATQSQLSSFLLQAEKQKWAMMSRCEILEKEMYTAALELQEKYSVSPEAIYELKLPTQEGEKGYFIKKED